MAKAPAIQLYVNDWTRDMEEHPLYIEGACMRIICKMWWYDRTGIMTRTVEQWAKILRTDIKTTTEIIKYLQDEKIFDIACNENVTGCNDFVTACNIKVTIKNRRMNKECLSRIKIKKRVQKYREKRESNDFVTPPSSSSSSSSCTKVQYKGDKKPKKFIPPTIEEVEKFIKENKYPIDHQKWYNHYESIGWKVGKNKMKNWQAAVRTWLPDDWKNEEEEEKDWIPGR